MSDHKVAAQIKSCLKRLQLAAVRIAVRPVNPVLHVNVPEYRGNVERAKSAACTRIDRAVRWAEIVTVHMKELTHSATRGLQFKRYLGLCQAVEAWVGWLK